MIAAAAAATWMVLALLMTCCVLALLRSGQRHDAACAGEGVLTAGAENLPLSLPEPRAAEASAAPAGVAVMS